MAEKPSAQASRQLHGTEHEPSKDQQHHESWGEWAKEKVEVLKEKAHELVDTTRETVHHLTAPSDKKEDDDDISRDTDMKDRDDLGSSKKDREDLSKKDLGKKDLSDRSSSSDRSFSDRSSGARFESERVAEGAKAGSTGSPAHVLKDSSASKQQQQHETIHHPNQSLKGVVHNTKIEGTKPAVSQWSNPTSMGSDIKGKSDLSSSQPNVQSGLPEKGLAGSTSSSIGQQGIKNQ